MSSIWFIFLVVVAVAAVNGLEVFTVEACQSLECSVPLPEGVVELGEQSGLQVPVPLHCRGGHPVTDSHTLDGEARHVRGVCQSRPTLPHCPSAGSTTEG